jgi:hypothetical protein
VTRISTSGTVVAAISTPKSGEEVTAAPFVVQPALTLLQPQNGLVTNNPTPTFILQYDALAVVSRADSRAHISAATFSARP